MTVVVAALSREKEKEKERPETKERELSHARGCNDAILQTKQTSIYPALSNNCTQKSSRHDLGKKSRWGEREKMLKELGSTS
jgi:hypothetical protein